MRYDCIDNNIYTTYKDCNDDLFDEVNRIQNTTDEEY